MSNAKNDSGAANLAHLLAALPSVAAPEGSAVLSRGGASVRGVCIGNDSSAEGCRACLAAAARNITGVCGSPAGRRGGAWSDGCFLAYYANADAPAARSDDRRKVLCDGDTPSSLLVRPRQDGARPGAVHGAPRVARGLPPVPHGGRRGRRHSGCYLRFEVSYRCAGRTRPAHGEARSRLDCSSAAAPPFAGSPVRSSPR